MPFIDTHKDGRIEYTDEEYASLQRVKAKVITVREKWYIGVPSVLMGIGEDLGVIGPSQEIQHSELDFNVYD